VAIAARPVPEGTDLGPARGVPPVRSLEPIRPGHKLALSGIRRGEPIVKYGQVIGFASRDIPAGSWVHVHNCSADRFDRDHAFSSEVPPPPPPEEPRTFPGYRRPDGRAGTRNYVAVVATVNCASSVVRFIADRFRADGLRDFPGVDGVLPIAHMAGCGMQHGGADHLRLERVLGGLARHPNVAACVLVGLGCETGEAGRLVASRRLVAVEGIAGEARPRPPAVILISEAGGTRRAVEAGVAEVRRLLPVAGAARRVPIPAGEIVLGTNCGGSDGWSGVTANPALGHAADRIVALGGTAVLGETPEIYGAEHILTRRAVSREVGERLVEKIRWWEWYVSVFGAKIDNNPSPGNKEGGLTTIYEKSLGAIAKGGTTALTAVIEYAEPVTAKGLVVMDTPGYDPTSMTGILAGGVTVCVFTTGRGSVYGSKPAPSIKVSTNTPLSERMPDDIDIDAGVILAGTPVETVGRRIFEEILSVAGGKRTRSEEAGLGEWEFSPWIVGPVL